MSLAIDMHTSRKMVMLQKLFEQLFIYLQSSFNLCNEYMRAGKDVYVYVIKKKTIHLYTDLAYFEKFLKTSIHSFVISSFPQQKNVYSVQNFKVKEHFS